MSRLLSPICAANRIIVVRIADNSLSFRNSCLLRLASYTESVRHNSKQDNRVSFLAQTGIAAFGKGMQLISGSPYAEAEPISQLCIADDSVSFRNICPTHFTTYTKNVLVKGHTTKQGCHISSLAQTGFAAFGKGMQLISGLFATPVHD